MTITEVAQLELKPGTDIKTEGEAKQIVDFVLETIAKQEGCLQLSSGVQVENSEIFVMVIEWSDINDHKKFQAKDEYKPFVEKVKGLITGEPGSLFLTHANFTAPISEVLAAPIVEMLLMYCPLDAGDEVPAAVAHVIDVSEKAGAAKTAAAYGWVVEELEWPEKFEGKAKGFRLALGWESLEKHMEYRETEAFKQSIPGLRSVVKASKVAHTVFTKYDKH